MRAGRPRSDCRIDGLVALRRFGSWRCFSASTWAPRTSRRWPSRRTAGWWPKARPPSDATARPTAASNRTSTKSGDATCQAIRQAVGTLAPDAIEAVGVSSQGGAIVLLDADDRPLGPVISWLDGRGLPWDKRLTEELGEDFLAEHLGRRRSAITPGQILRLQRRPRRSGSPGCATSRSSATRSSGVCAVAGRTIRRRCRSRCC